MKVLTLIKIFAMCVSTTVFLACSSAPKIHSLYEAGVDFDQFKTFGFLDEVAPSAQQYSGFVGKYLKKAISQEMQSRGLQLSDKPDLLVGFNVHKEQKIEVDEYARTTGPYYGYYGYRAMYGYSFSTGIHTETRVSDYTEGTLNIDVVDNLSKQLIWEGVAVGRLKKKLPENLEQKVADIVAQVFAEYPVRPK